LKNLCLCLVLLPVLALAGMVTQELSFAPAELQFSKWQGYDVVDLERGIIIPDPGKPCLPVVPLTLVVPADCRVTDVKVSALSPLTVAREFNLVPSQPATPLSGPAPVIVPPDPLAFSHPFPAAPLVNWRTGNAAGFKLVSVNLCPLEYLPERRLVLYSSLAVTVSFEEQACPAPAVSAGQAERTARSLSALVTNPGDLSRFAPPAAAFDQQAVDYLVITGDRLAPDFAPFVEFQNSRGLATAVRTVEWANRNYPGRDMQERVRNLIKDYFEHRGTSYVLLAGDNAVVPCRRIRVSVGAEQGDIPTDLYYSDLDYSWDSNHNNLFGEMDDSVDLYSDVTLGRASVDNATEVQTFISKVRKYGEDPATDYVKRSLLPSGWLWRSIGYHGKFVNDSIANRTPTGWTDVKLENPTSAQVVADSFDHGFSIFDPAGHGNENGVYDESGTAFYTSGLARNQRNDRRFTVTTSLACNPGNFEAEDCLAEHSHNAPSGGSIAVMMNSRYGWGTPPSMGPSEKLCVRFYDFLLSRNVTEIGACHARSCEEYAGAALYDALWRWCMTEFNLFADPTLDFWTEAPAQLAVTAPDSIPTGGQSLDVVVMRGSTPVSGVLVAAYKSGECQVTGITNGSGRASLELHPVTPGEVSLTATGHNLLPGKKTLRVYQSGAEPLLLAGRLRIDDSGQPNPNGILEPGETGMVWLTARNAGTAPATSVAARLRTLAPKLTVLDSTADYGTIAAGDSSEGSGFVIRLAPDITPGSNPELSCAVHSAEGDWALETALVVGYPGRTWADLDTGNCGLTVTARGSIGFDVAAGHAGRGFRFPETDTSTLNAASFCLACRDGYVADRFYSLANGSLDADWTLAESLKSLFPLWGTQQTMLGAFTDAGHPSNRQVRVTQRALASAAPDERDFVALVYDVANQGGSALSGVHAGVLADFDVKATDRFHDLALALPDQHTVFTWSRSSPGRYVGICHLTPDLPTTARVIDHCVYVYPDSGLSESMKYRLLAGLAGSAASDRPYNWSLAVGSGPFELAPGAGRRLGFAFVAAPDSAAYLAACARARNWYANNVGTGEPGRPGPDPAEVSCLPSPFRGRLHVSTRLPVTDVSAFDPGGRRVALVHSGSPLTSLEWDAGAQPNGVYLLRLTGAGRTLWTRVTLAR